MRITFLGHQGWRFENGGRSLLLDPLLESIGNGRATLPVWPKRRLDFAKLGPIDGVIVSHEHADHFSLETLAALPPSCGIYLSDLSSAAMATAITELGFEVARFSALQPFAIAGLTLTALPGLYNTLEPDTYGLLVQDGTGASFLTGIDTVPHPDVLGWLARHCPQRTLDNLTNNFVEPRQPLVEDARAAAKSRATVVGSALEFVQKFAPRRAVVSGQGWCFENAKARFNHSFFSVDNGWLTGAVRELAPQVQWHEGVPGLRFTLNGGDIAVDTAPDIGELQRPSRAFDPASVRVAEPFAPWSETPVLPPNRLDAVRGYVARELGPAIGAHAPNLVQRLYYLKFQDDARVVPALGITLRNASARHAYLLDYGALTFVEAAHGARPAAVGIELWAGDLELMIAAEEDAYMIAESAVRTWTHAPALVDSALLLEAFQWFTPRFRPREFLAHYRARIADLRAPRPARHANGGSRA